MKLNLLIKNRTIIILSMIIFFQLVINYRLIKSVQKVNEKDKKLVSQLFEFDGKGKLLNPLPHYYNEIRYRSDIFKKPGRNPYIVVLFDDKSCTSCVYENVCILNEIYSQYSSNIIVYFQGDKGDYLDSFNPIFPYESIQSSTNLFTKKMDYAKPLVFLIGDNDIVYDILRVEVGVKQKSNLFYNKVKGIFNLNKK